MKRMIIVFLLIGAVAGCGKGDSNPSGPSSSGPSVVATPNPCATSQSCGLIDSIGFWFRIQSNDSGAPGGSWTLTFLDKTYTASGNAEYGFINMNPGDYQVSGQFPTSSFTLTFGRQGGGRGGVTPNSIRSLEGPIQSTTGGSPPGCSASYFVPFGAPKPNTFKVQFTVASGNFESC